MATEGLRKHTTVLFNGVTAAQQTKWGGLLADHRNLHNHQLVVTADQTLTGGVFSISIVPDADGVGVPVDTGLVLDMTGRDSARIFFTGVIRGLILRQVSAIPEGTALISSVLSSFSRQKQSDVSHNRRDELDYVSSDLAETNSGFTSLALRASNHTNMPYHQLSVTCSTAITDQYHLRIIPDTQGQSLETTVDTDILLDFAGGNSVLIRFGGIIAGVHLLAEGAVTGGGDVRVVLSSAVERFDEVVYDFIGVSPVLDDHLTDFDNPHQTSWDNLLNKPEAFPEWEVVPVSVTVTVPADKQLLIWENYDVLGTVIVEADGRLVILHDRPETRLSEPDFTYNMSGELTQIDYAGGEQKLFTYNTGQLTQVDALRDGTTLRKTFTYTGGGELDYITEEWLDNS